MSRPRLILIVAAATVTLILLLWLANMLVGLYTGLSLFSPLLARFLLGVILILLVGLIIAAIYYTVIFLRPKRSRPRPIAPRHKAEAAEQSLEAVRQQVEQIQDTVAREALLERAQEIEASRHRGPIRVVVFGTGSAGKTSLVNAVLGRVAGDVGAPMGTTGEEQSYRLRLRGLDREVWLTDTPGILEAGIVGTEREQRARELATDANLLLVVIDNDLRQTEYESLRSLVDMGKRSLLVFNKIDLYPDADREVILNHLRQRVYSFLSPDDVVAIAAAPQPVALPNGDQFQPEVDITPLLRRMAAVLRSEGENLVADNILFQSQRLSADARRLIDDQRLQQANEVVNRFQWIGAGVVSFTPVPVVDLLATAAVNAQMVVELGRVYGCEMNIDHGKALASSLAKTLVSLGVVRGAIEIFSVALQTNVSTFLIGRAVQGATAAYLTRIAGKSFIEYFRNDQDWGDGGMTEVVQEQFQLNRRDEFMKTFVQEAIANIVRPLTQAEPVSDKET
jgi:small GTP-binding protein